MNNMLLLQNIYFGQEIYIQYIFLI